MDVVDARASRLSLSARKPSVITHSSMPSRTMCVCLSVCVCMSVRVCAGGGAQGKDGPSVLLNPGQDFSLLRVYTTESSEGGGGIKVFYVLNTD